MMNYFDELLESYSSIKKRTFKLKLVEGSEQHPQYQKIKSIVLQAISSGQTRDFSDLGRPDVSLEATARGDIKAHGIGGGWGDSGVKVSDRGQIKPKWVDVLVNALLPDEGGVAGGEQTRGEQEKAHKQLEAQIAQQERLDFISNTLGTELHSKYDDIAKNVVSKLHKELGKSNKIYKSAKFLEGFLTGTEPRSFLMKLTNGTSVEMDSELAKVTQGLSQDLAQEVTTTFMDALSILSRKELTDSDKSFLWNNFMIGDLDKKNPTIYIASNRDMNKGVILKDANSLPLYNTLKLANIEYRDFATKKEANSDASFRGVNLEKILEPISILATAAKMGSESLKAQGIKALNRFRKELDSMAKVHTYWTKPYERGEIALDADDMQLVDEINNFFGGEMKAVMSGIVSISKQALKIRNPDFILRVGGDNLIGKKADTFEVWTSEEEAIKGLKRQGVADANVEVMSARLAFAGHSGALKAAIESKMIESPKSDVYVNKVSLKSYMDMNNAKLGENNAKRTGALIKAMSSKDFSQIDDVPFSINKLKDKLLDGMGIEDKDTFLKESADYYKSLESIEDHVMGVESIKQVVTGDGNKIDEDALEKLTNSLLDSIKMNTTYDEFSNRTTLAGSIVGTMKNLDFNDPKERDKAVTNINRYIKLSKIKSDLSKEQAAGEVGPATKYLLMDTALLAGSGEQDISSDFRDLNKGVSYNFKHDAALNNVLKGVISGEWKLDTRAGVQVSMVNKQDPKQRLIHRTETKSNGGKRFQNNIVDFSRGYLEAVSVKNRVNESLSIEEENFLNEIISEQYKLFKAELIRFQGSSNLQS